MFHRCLPGRRSQTRGATAFAPVADTADPWHDLHSGNAPERPDLKRLKQHSNWQWWHLVKNSRPIILDDPPTDCRPLVQVVDNFERKQKPGMVFETKVGPGKLLICAIDLLGLRDKPEARQLLHSLLQYVDSAALAAQATLDADLLRRLFADT